MSVKDDQLMKSLLGKLYQVLTGGDNDVQAPTETFVAWCSPGIPFTAEDLVFAEKGLQGSTAEETKTLLDQASDFARAVNLIPDASGVLTGDLQQTVFDNRGQLLWDVYGDILDSSKVPDKELTEEEKVRLERFDGLLTVKKPKINIITGQQEGETTEPGPVAVAYEEKSADYDAAALQYNNKRISAMNADDPKVVQDWALNAALYRRQAQRAYNAWVSSGYKNEYEQIAAYKEQVFRRNLMLRKQQLRANFEAALETDMNNAQFYRTSVVPAGFAQREEGWTEFSFSESNYESYSRSETNSWQAEASYGKWLFSASVSTSGSISESESSIDTSNFSMSFDLVQVPISRPWFGVDFVMSKAWKFDAEEDLLSDGQKPPHGRLVAYPTTAVFIRDLKVNFDELHNRESSYSQNISVSANVRYGPFRFSGSYNRSVGEGKIKTNMSDQGLEVQGLQLIALKCALLGKAPDPDSSITDWA